MCLAVLLAAATTARASSIYTFASAEGFVDIGGIRFSGATSGSSNAYLGKSEELRGPWTDHGIDYPDTYFGYYSLNLLATADAGYGYVGLYTENSLSGGSWRWPTVAGVRTYAEAGFEDDLYVASALGNRVDFIFDVQGTQTNLGGPTLQLGSFSYCSINESYDPTGNFHCEVEVGPDHLAHLNVRFWLDNGDDGKLADYSLRLLSAEVLCSDCAGQSVSNQSLYTQNRYSDVANIQQVPEPATLWPVAFVLTLFPLRLALRRRDTR
ncbi:MAG: hypothetical protein IPP47_24350 [Bryobacterales bacterium]|nr:hypothetical protein [Bryobacterales bacterium]